MSLRLILLIIKEIPFLFIYLSSRTERSRMTTLTLERDRHVWRVFSTYIYVALFILGNETLFIVTMTRSTVKLLSCRLQVQLRILRKISEISRFRTWDLSIQIRSASQTAAPRALWCGWMNGFTSISFNFFPGRCLRNY